MHQILSYNYMHQIQSALRKRLGTRFNPRSQKKLKKCFFFLLKFNMVCTFWIVLMC
jgi:hypothetical protein